MSILDPKNNRISYVDTLKPPKGYEIKYAIGTTYTLNLEALMSICVALNNHEDESNDNNYSGSQLIHDIKAVSGKMIVFWNRGQMAEADGSEEKKQILTLMGDCVVEMTKSKDGFTGVFHPKIWLMVYSAEGNPNKKMYRFVVLSRNITFDRSWDVILCLDGEKSKNVKKTEPIMDLIQYLAKQKLSEKQKNILTSILGELEQVEFKIKTDDKSCCDFDDFELMPLGIGENSYMMCEDSLLDDRVDDRKKEKLVIMSPFITGEIIERLASNRKECHLFTRETELGKIENLIGNKMYVYVLKKEIVDGEDQLEDSDGRKLQDIHAKMFFINNTEKKESFLYVGSMNATHHAVECNGEMMVKLRYKNNYSVKAFLRDITGCKDFADSENPFVEINSTNIEEYTNNKEQGVDYRDILELIDEWNPSGSCEKISSGDEEEYAVTVSFKGFCLDTLKNKLQDKIRDDKTGLDKIRKDMEVKISMFCNKKEEKPIGENVTFATGKENICEWYVISINDAGNNQRFVIKIPTTGIPEDREDIIIEKNNSLESVYLNIMMNLDPYCNYGREMLQKTMNGDGSGKSRFMKGNQGMFELLIKNAIKNPEIFDKFDYIFKMQNLNDEKDSEQFDKMKKMYEVIKTVYAKN